MSKRTREWADQILHEMQEIQDINHGHLRAIEHNENRITALQLQLLEQFEEPAQPSWSPADKPKEDELELQRSFQSQTNPHVTYFVSKWADGSITCTCPGFTYREHCRHADECANSFGW